MKLIHINEHTLGLQLSDEINPYLAPNSIDLLAEVVNQINQNNAIHSVICMGTTKYYSAGASLESLVSPDPLPVYVRRIPELIVSINVPTIAAMQGHGIGGGLIMGLWSDLTIMAEESLYGANFMSIGFTPGMGSTMILEESFGAFFAREMMFTGRMLKGREIKQNAGASSVKIVPKDQVYPVALNLAEELAAIPRHSLMLLKKTLAKRRFEQFKRALDEEENMHAQLFTDPETRKIINSRYQVSLDSK
jgi:polyketide biosynthesis enoyl-CoA hydratase PksI